MASSVFQLGINYWPRRKAMYWWKEFDGGEVDEEFAQIATLGVESVRFFLLWEDFQPASDRVDHRQLENLVTVLDTAQRHHLRATPTLLVGNMSNLQWWPPWAFSDQLERATGLQISEGRYVDREVRSVFADPGMLEAETLLAREVAKATAGHPALEGWDLANEIDQIRQPANPEVSRNWVETVSQALHSAPIPAVTYGAHAMSLTTRGLTIPAIAPSLDYLAMHGYPMYSSAARGPLDPEFVPFVTLLTAELGSKPCLMQEFGAPTAGPGEPSRSIEDWMLGKKTPVFLAGEEEAATYIGNVLDRLWQTGAMGALIWNYADYAPSLWTKPPLDRAHRERWFGLFRANGTAKPGAEVTRSFAAELRTGAIEQRLGPHGGKRKDLGVQASEYYSHPEQSLAEWYRRYLEAYRR